MASGLALAAAMTSWKFLYGLLGSVATTLAAVPISSTGSRSFSVSNGRFCRNGLTAWVSNTNTQLLPSGGALATIAVPMLPEAPGLFSMMMVVPSFCCRPGCTIRAIGSTVPPGGNGTMTRVTLPDCARARETNGAAAAPSMRVRLVSFFMAFPAAAPWQPCRMVVQIVLGFTPG